MAVTRESTVEEQLEFYKRRCEYYKNKNKALATELSDIRREWEKFRWKWARRKKNYRDMQKALEVARLREQVAYDRARIEYLKQTGDRDAVIKSGQDVLDALAKETQRAQRTQAVV